MELYQLNTFVKIADEGSLTRAAELLFTSQPAISAQIKALEEELGVALFDRTSRGMQLTDKGKLLYGQAVDTLDAAARLKNEARQLQQELVGELKIGVHTDFDFMRVGELHRHMQQQHARVRPHFIQSMSAQILPDIRRGLLDAGFFFGHCSPVDLTLLSLGSVPMRIVGPADWADRIREATLQQLARLPWIYTSDSCPFYTLAQQLFADDAGSVQKVAYVDSEDAVRELVRAGVGLSLLRASDADRLEKAGEAICWLGDTPSINLGFAVHRQRSAEPMIDALTTQVSALWENASVQSSDTVSQPG